MIPQTDRAIEATRRIASNKPDDQVCLIEAGVLLALIAAATDHVHCEVDADDALADLRKDHETDRQQLASDAWKPLSELDEAIKDMQANLQKLRDLL